MHWIGYPFQKILIFVICFIFTDITYSSLRRATYIRIFLFESKRITNRIKIYGYFSQPYIHVHIDLNTYINKYSLQVKILILLEVGIFFLMFPFIIDQIVMKWFILVIFFSFFQLLSKFDLIFHAFRNYNMKPLVRHQDCLKFI